MAVPTVAGLCELIVDIPFAKASSTGRQPAHDRVAGLRRLIGSAIRRGDVAAIAREYVALARALVDSDQLAAARKELEEGILIVTAGATTREPSPPVARLLLAISDLPREQSAQPTI